MKILIPIQELKNMGSRWMVPLECEICNKTFYKPKNLVLRGLKGMRKVAVCGEECRKKLLSKKLKSYYISPNKSYSRKENVMKKELIDLLGGQCLICGYDGCLSSLTFHHRDPAEKSFSITRGISKKVTKEKLIEEVKKCALLCANCHGEIHDGVISLPD